MTGKNILVVVFVLFFAGCGLAQGQGLVFDEPYLSISVAEGLNLGNIGQPGQHVFTQTLTVHIMANIGHHLEVSLQPFVGPANKSIPIERTSVEMLNPISSPGETSPGGVDVKLNLKFNIETRFEDPAGSYTGTLTLTIIPGP